MKMTKEGKERQKERMLRIITDYSGGASYSQLAEKYYVSKERIYQILKKAKKL